MTAPARPVGAEILRDAFAVLDGRIPLPEGRGLRAAAILGRQALERSIDHRCLLAVPMLRRPSMRSKLILIRSMDAGLGVTAQAAWDGLSRACHQHPYELQPTELEVRQLLKMVVTVVRTPG